MSHATMRASVLLALPLLLLTGCAGGTSAPPAAGGSAAPSAASSAPLPDLSGKWKQTNSKSKDAYQEASISGDTITVNWVSDGGDTESLYWAGSFDAPTKAGDYSWTSKNDTSKTKSAMLASSDKTKAFTYSGGQISYKVSLMGTTATVRLSKE